MNTRCLLLKLVSAGLVVAFSAGNACAQPPKDDIGRGLDFVFGGIGKVTGIHETGMEIPSDWKTINISGVKFGVSPQKILMYGGVNGFLYDPTTGMTLTNTQGLCVAGSPELKKYLTSFANSTEAWQKYLDDHTCDNDIPLSGVVEQSVLLGSLKASGKCTTTYDNVAAWAQKLGTTLNRSEGNFYSMVGFKPLADTNTVRGSLISDLQKEYGVDKIHMGKKGLFSKSNLEPGIELLKKSSAEILTKYSEIEKHYPPEDEIVQLKDVKINNKWTKVNSWPVGKTELLNTADFYDFVGWNFWNNDAITGVLTHVDFALRAPDFDPAFADSVSYIWDDWNKKLGNQRISVEYWKTQFSSTSLNEDKSNTEDNGRYLEWKLEGVENRKALWLNWGKFLATLTPDELREMVLSAGKMPYRDKSLVVKTPSDQNAVNGALESFWLDWPSQKIKERNSTRSDTLLMHNSALLMANGLALSLNYYKPQAINVPTHWTGSRAPGLSLRKYLFMYMNSSVSKSPEAVGWKMLQAVEKNDFAAATKALHTLDSALADMKTFASAKERGAAERLPVKTASMLSGNPSKEYQSLAVALGHEPDKESNPLNSAPNVHRAVNKAKKSVAVAPPIDL